MDEKLNRREFFKEGFSRLRDGVVQSVAAVTVPLEEEKKPAETLSFIRPPGALPEEEFLEKCTRCNECVKVCPEESIMKFVGEGSPHHLTPMLNLRKSACVLCKDFPCVSVCEPKALIRPESTRHVKMGTAIINEKLCYAWASGADCDYCIKDCPFPGEAIYLDKKRRPMVVEEVCTGCGLCENICPTRQSAITVKKF